MSAKGQTINDRINAAKYTLAGQALARCICKATTEELMRPKMKHLEYLAASTYQSNVSMQQLTNLLIERTNHSNWAVVYKALITVHRLMCHGSERFTQYLASSNYTFQLSNFLDRIVTKGYEMSQFIRRYSNYINEKALCYRKLALDMCRNQRKKGEDGVMRTMSVERLLETLPIIQKQLDCLLEFGCSAEDISNSIITASFTLLYHDIVRLFANYNDGIICLIEKYFDLNKKLCREAFETYKKFLASTDRVYDFLKVAEAINLDRGELPDFKRGPQSLLDAFEQHLISLESNKKRDTRPQVDTKLAAFPSFSINNEVDSNPQPASVSTKQQINDQQQILGDISREFEAQLNFATSDNDAFGINAAPKETLIANNNNNTFNDDIFTVQSNVDRFIPPFQTISADKLSEPAKSNLNSPFDSSVDEWSQPIGTTIKTLSNGSELFDIKPPGFSDGALLTPEALQIDIDPSIDPHTKQQLIQIKREQVLASRQSGNSNSQRAASSTQSSSNAKSSKEVMFEDLEKTMRQSLLKTERT